MDCDKTSRATFFSLFGYTEYCMVLIKHIYNEILKILEYCYNFCSFTCDFR